MQIVGALKRLRAFYMHELECWNPHIWIARRGRGEQPPDFGAAPAGEGGERRGPTPQAKECKEGN